MAAPRSSFLLLLAAALIGIFAFCVAAAVHSHDLAGAAVGSSDGGGDGTKVYVVFTERQPAAAELPEVEAGAAIASFHYDMLGTVLDASSSAPDRVVYHYSRGLHGFAARLTEDEKNKLATKDGVLSIHEKVVYWPHTTRSWDFLGLPQKIDSPAGLKYQNDVVIGMLDTGVWPESDSFSGEGLPPPPAKPRWKGSCSKNFTCNNKIIGARGYNNGSRSLSPRDDEGHGTHTASTAAGRAVAGASFMGLAGGTARGAVPGARLAIYKVCWANGCASEDIMAALDDAIADGVDVISASFGNDHAVDYADDTLAVGAFHAMRSGVVTSVSAGNSGPYFSTVANFAPWTISVAANNDDRKIISEIVLGNGKRIAGNAVTAFPDLANTSVLLDAGHCDDDTLNGRNYKGVVLLCGSSDFGISASGIMATGADGAIVYQTGDSQKDIAFSFASPIVIVLEEEYKDIVRYYNATRLSMATLKNSVTVKNAASPAVAEFSSRGPSRITPGILKPDLSAPGVDILAAWSPLAPLSGNDDDKRSSKFNIISGTSMSCPHVTGVAAYVKSVHPAWSQAAVLSALVTTATPMGGSADPGAELAYGAGQVNPVAAADPGLVYDATEADYVRFLCGQGYNSTQLATMTGNASVACSAEARASAAGDLNYPSIGVLVPNFGVPFAAEFPRTVTNVGGPDGAVYRANVTTVPGINVTVTPAELAFSAANKTLSFKVNVSGSLRWSESAWGASASVVWSDGKHRVRSPVFVFSPNHLRRPMV